MLEASYRIRGLTVIVIGIVALVAAAILIMSGIAQAKIPSALTGETPMTPPAEKTSWTRSELESMAESVAFETGLDPYLVKAVISTESSWNPTAVNPSDPSYGILQVTVPIAIAYGVISNADEKTELLKPMNGLRAGCRFLAYLVKTYPLDDAIQMYNLGETKFRNGARVPAYLSKVKGYYNELRST